MNLQLPSEHQRLFVLIGVGVVALLGLFLVTRGLGGGETSSPPSPAPAQTAPAKPGKQGSDKPSGGSSERTPSKGRSEAKRSREAYVNCVTQATDPAALEKCQALVP
jgi:hypothetical protein